MFVYPYWCLFLQGEESRHYIRPSLKPRRSQQLPCPLLLNNRVTPFLVVLVYVHEKIFKASRLLLGIPRLGLPRRFSEVFCFSFLLQSMQPTIRQATPSHFRGFASSAMQRCMLILWMLLFWNRTHRGFPNSISMEASTSNVFIHQTWFLALYRQKSTLSI